MAFQVVIKAEARKDVIEAYHFYETKLTGLGDIFLESFENRCHDLSQNPSFYSLISEDPKAVLRDVKLNRFPFVLVFEIIASEVIVYAVHCTYIDPEKKLRNE